MSSICKDTIKEIYSHICDDESREIFKDRLMYSLTDDYSYIRHMVLKRKETAEVSKKLWNSDKKVLYGAGLWGENILKIFPDIKWECIIDRDCKKNSLADIPVITFEKYKQLALDAVIVIASRKYHKEIFDMLLSGGISEEKIINMGSMLDVMYQRQYFDPPFLKREKEEIFVDGGCFDMQSSFEFARWCNNRYTKIFAFEPDRINYEKCLQMTAPENTTVINKGLWNSREKLFFESNGENDARISSEGNDFIIGTALDEELYNEKITFIKMDIEGAELNALKGCGKTVKEFTPKLAICVYHKPEDIWEIPDLILRMNDSYKLYLRHYSFANNDTVLYAVP